MTQTHSRTSSTPRRIASRVALFLLAGCLLFLSIGAWYGGLALVRDPSGGAIGLPLELLTGSPFSSYLIPGWILLLVFGLGPLPVVPALLSNRRWPGVAGHGWPWLGAFSLAVGLLIWLLVQVLVIGWAGGIQFFYLLFCVALCGLVSLPAVRHPFRLDRQARPARSDPV